MELSSYGRGRRKRFGFLLVCFVFSSFGNAVPDGYHDEPAETIYKIHDILIANNLCQIEQVEDNDCPEAFKNNKQLCYRYSQQSKYGDCSRKNLVFGARTTHGFIIYTYAITNKEVLRQIVSLLKSKYIRYDKKTTIEFVATNITWEEEYNRSFFRKLWSSFFGKNDNDIIMTKQFKRSEQ